MFTHTHTRTHARTHTHTQAEALQQSSSVKFDKLSETGKQGGSHDSHLHIT